MPAVTNVRDNIAQTEYQKFVSLSADSNFPLVSAYFGYDDGLSACQSFFKTAILTYPVGSGSGNTRGQTLTAGSPVFTPSTLMLYNSAATPQTVSFTLISGLTCNVWVPATNVITIPLAVASVNGAYNSITITYIAP